MNVRMLAPANVAAAALAVGGVLILAMPWHAASIVRIVVLTAAAAAALHAVARVVPEWTAALGSPFARAAPRPAPSESAEIDRIADRLGARRQPVGDDVWLPPETLRLLQPLIRGALERAGLRRSDGSRAEAGSEPIRSTRTVGAADARLAPLTVMVLAADPLPLPDWWRTRRGAAGQVADIVHDVLDDLDRLSAPYGTHGRRPGHPMGPT